MAIIMIIITLRLNGDLKKYYNEDNDDSKNRNINNN